MIEVPVINLGFQITSTNQKIEWVKVRKKL